jgi:glycosyltransferase involved in cell wall biosynthesis
MMAVLTLSLVKVGGLTPAIFHPEELQRRGWKFARVLQDTGFLNEDLNIARVIQTERPIDACFIGRVAPSKGVMDLLDVWSMVTTARQSSRLVIAGSKYSESFERKVNRVINQKGLRANVERLGYLSNDDKARLLSRAQLFVFPSYEEGWSLGVMEAALHGCVPVLYNLHAYDYLRCSAIKAPPGNRSRMSRLILELLGRPEYTAEIRAHLSTTIAGYTKSTIAEETAQQLEEIASFFGEPR